MRDEGSRPGGFKDGQGLKLLYVVTGTNLAGAEMQVLNLARGMRRRGHEVQLLSLAPPGPVARLAAEDGLSVQSLNIRRRSGLLRALLGVARSSARVRPDILHSHLVHANLLARVSRLLAPVPALISTGHSVREGGEWSLQAYRLTDGLCDLTTSVSRLALQRYLDARAAPAGKLRYVANGLDLAAFDRAAATPVATPPASPETPGALSTPGASPTPGTFSWIAVGRFEQAKDYPTMLRAFAQIAADAPEARLDIVGEGRGLEEARAQVQALGLAERVRFLGARHDVPALLSGADGYLMSSAWEGLPMVLLEAGAARLPVVATAVGSVPDAVLHERSGLLVPPRDPAALAGAMARLMQTPAAGRAQMGAAARDHIERHFGLDSVLDDWEQIYTQVLRRRRDQGRSSA